MKKENIEMKKLAVLGLGLCVALSFSSCKSSESAYKKAYEKAKQKELAEAQTAAPAEETAPVTNATPVVAAPVETARVVESVSAPVREERVIVVTGAESGLKNYSVVCGSFGVKANADGVKAQLEADGYQALVVRNDAVNTFRVIVSSFDDRASAEQARDAFKARYPQNADFQKAWLLYRIK